MFSLKKQPEDQNICQYQITGIKSFIFTTVKKEL